MLLSFGSQFLSIQAFQDVRIPLLTVLTGLNGTGKSHLLSAIQKGHIRLTDPTPKRIALFSFENFRVGGEQEFTGQQLADEADQAYNIFEQNIKINGPGWSALLQNNQHDTRTYDQRFDQAYMPNIKQHIANTQHLKNNPMMNGLLNVLARYRLPIEQISRSMFVSVYRPTETTNDLPSAIGKVFVSYRQKQIENAVAEVENRTFSVKTEVLTDEQFVAANGPPPWDVINSVLSQSDNIQYEVTNPLQVRFRDKFRLRLKHRKTPNLEINFEDLSSGEKILMALVALVYKQAADNTFPDLVLLDEVDATLHPSMIRWMLSVVDQVFTKREIHTLIVTHSPTTVSLAHENSIYVMNKEGMDRIVPKGREQALSILTEGFATIDEGMLLFERTSQDHLSIITEGNNTVYIKEALRHSPIEGVKIIEDAEALTGKNTLKTLFEFFKRVNKGAKVLFVWDCDVNYGNLTPANGVYPFVIAQNAENQLSPRGIENAFSADICRIFSKTETDYRGRQTVLFDPTAKKAIQDEIVRRNDPKDFVKFQPLLKMIQDIKDEK